MGGMVLDPRAAVDAVASLAEPTRRRVYELVARARRGLTRDDVTEATGLPRTTAAFHLDRLVEEGLLSVGFERRTGRTGPGAGRPSKVYSRSDASVAVSLPPRQYDLAAELLAAAVEDADATGQPVRTCLERRAYAAGHALGRPDVASALADSGYEPYAQGDAIALANCPFHAVAGRHTDLVCGMNLHLVEGLLDAAGAAGLQARLDPSPGHCCVRIEPRVAGAAEAPEPHRG